MSTSARPLLPLLSGVLALAAGGCAEGAPELDPAPTHEVWARALASFQTAEEHGTEVADAIVETLAKRYEAGNRELVAYLDANLPAREAFFEAARPERTFADHVRLAPPGEQQEDLGLGLMESRGLTDLMLVEARRLSRGRKADEAIAHALACLRFALQHQRAEDGILITSTIGRALHGRVLTQLREILHDTRLDEEQLRGTLDELLRIRAGWPGFDEVYLRDRHFMKALCMQGFAQDGIEETNQVRLTKERYDELDRKYNELYVRAWRERDPSIIREPLAELEAELDGLNERLPIPPPTPEELADVTVKLILQLTLDKLASSIDADLVARVELDMVCVALAGRLYELDHGELPRDLELLVPDYLDELPEDPFDKGQPVKLKDIPDYWVLYSIGPDRVDQKGLLERTPGAGNVGDILSAARCHHAYH